jgi:hypothetical protein
MEACSERTPLTADQIRERLAAEEEQPKAQPSRRSVWPGLLAACMVALGATASLSLSGVASEAECNKLPYNPSGRWGAFVAEHGGGPK